MLFNNSAGLSEFRRRPLKLRGTPWGIGRAVGILVSPPDPRPSNRPSLRIWNREHLQINKTLTCIRSVTDEAVADWSKTKKLVRRDLLITTFGNGLSESWDRLIAQFLFRLSNTQGKPQNTYSSPFLWRERVRGCDPMLISLSCVL